MRYSMTVFPVPSVSTWRTFLVRNPVSLRKKVRSCSLAAVTEVAHRTLLGLLVGTSWGGRAINFSTLVTNTELSFAEYRQLLGNAANWARVADLAVTNTGIPDPVQSGAPITYTITASNNGPSIALAIALTDELSVHTTFQSLAPPQGWSCNTPPVGETGTVTCTKPSAGLGEPEIFTLVANVNVG